MIIMAAIWIGNLEFAARDRHAGATDLNDKNEYIRSKACKILGPMRI